MARIRSIKPEFFRHFDLYKAEHETGLPIRVAFAGLWTCADREGRFKWRPEELKVEILPHDQVDFSRVMDALLTRGFLVKYAWRGSFFGSIPSWRSHQFINGKEKPSSLPSVEDNDSKIIDMDTREERVVNTSRRDVKDGVKERKGKEGKGRDIVVSDDPIGHNGVIAYFKKRFEERAGGKWHCDGGKVGRLVKGLLKTHSAARLIELVDKFFALEDPWLQKTGYDFPIFYSQINKLTGDSNGVGKIKNAGLNSLAEWSGRTMVPRDGEPES